MCALDRLADRREAHCMRFAKRCLKHGKFKNLFLISGPDPYIFRSAEKYEVNFASTDHLCRVFLKTLCNDEVGGGVIPVQFIISSLTLTTLLV